MKGKLMAVLAMGVLTLGTASLATADMITGYLYSGVTIDVSGSETQDYKNAQTALVNIANASAATGYTDDFYVDNIDFSAPSGTTLLTYSAFLSSGSSNNLTGLANASALMTTAHDSADIFRFEGVANFSSNFSIYHDDGFVLELIKNGSTIFKSAYTGTDADSSWPTGPAYEYFTVTEGTYNFVLTYESWNGNPEVLKTSGVTFKSVPEPATTLLIGLGLAGLVGFRMRKRN
ncbi:PEP-CTERM sorting domain-containing protein [Desulfopila sp. IMCC35006]|uniref:PEP-CTERM sorting domain-containing protein n=1 Tax=Desulfopila sp. IMCC35006 TaxID=2569542 RepID=UPI0010ABA766|nr:PEP-CTERM sorting domain-containing protein [Desulfopila sp. IMCC35006]TKB25012.1 PEP-CTERM sorting domain-containing protein [Desulfopila sp. IMCC35006]